MPKKQKSPEVLKIKGLRDSVGLTQAEFAKLTGFGLRTVAAWERGERKIKPRHIALYTQYCRKSIVEEFRRGEKISKNKASQEPSKENSDTHKKTLEIDKAKTIILDDQKIVSLEAYMRDKYIMGLLEEIREIGKENREISRENRELWRRLDKGGDGSSSKEKGKK